MSAQNYKKGTITTAATVNIELQQGEAYGLIIGTEASNFNTQTITPKLSNGANTGAAAQGTLTVDTQPTAGDTFTIGSRVYTLVANDQTPKGNLDQIQLGANLAATQANIVAAINGTDTDPYAIERHADVSAAAFSANASVITARRAGTAGNTIATTETFTAGTNVFNAATLGTTTAGTNTYASAIALPTIGSSDSSGSPQAFAAYGMIEFVAILPHLLLVMSGAPTSVEWHLTRLEAYRKRF